MKFQEHNPLYMPEAGDSVVASVGGDYVTRTVVYIDSADTIYYEDSRGLKTRECNINSWQIWCRDKGAQVIRERKLK